MVLLQSTRPTGTASSRRYRSAATSLLRWIIAPMTTVLATSFVIFVALSFAPGDPVAQILGGRASDEDRAILREQLGLNDNVIARYFHWLGDALQGDLGISVISRQQVTDLLMPRIVTTGTLVLMAAFLIIIFGIALGALGGTRPRARSLVNGITGLGVAVPSFVAATVLISVFAVGLGWFPTYGAGSGFLDRIWHLTLPAISLSIGFSAYVAQLSAAAISEEVDREHVVTAVGRGLPRSLVLRRHVMRNASIPILTASGLTVAGLVAGSVIVETAFAIDGLGSLLVKSISSKDYAPATAIAVIIVVVFVTITTLIDLIQVRADPRLRKGA